MRAGRRTRYSCWPATESRPCSARRPRCSPTSPGEALAGHLLRAALRLHHRLRPARATRCCSPTSSAPTRAPGWSTRRSPSARTTSGSASSTGSPSRTRSGWTAPSTSASPTSPAARSRRPTPTSSRRWRRTGRLLRAETYLHSLSALLALRHAAALLREVELVRGHQPGQGPACWPRTSRSAGTPSTSSTAASASGSRTTSTGRSPATATGAPRCRSGSARPPTARSASAPARVEDLSERGGEVPDDLHRPYIDEVVLPCEREGAAARCAATRR